jgi:hypothetical protein
VINRLAIPACRRNRFQQGRRPPPPYPGGAKVFLPASIEHSVWEYFAAKAEELHVPLSDLLTEILRRDMEIAERGNR